jgi:ABC-type transport system involved in multi-copper enzyme maturation permease subunit
VSAVTPTIPKLDAPGKVTFPRVLLAEWTKFRSVRSTKWSLGIAILLTIAIPLIGAAATRSHWDSTQTGGAQDALGLALVGVYIAQLAIAVLGILTITAEYSTGSIRSTLTAVPKRLPVLWAKLIDFAVVSIALMVPAVLVSFFATQAILNPIPELHVSLSAPGVTRCVLLAPVYVMLVGTFAIGLGAIIRNTAGAFAAFAGIFFVVYPLLQVFPTSWQDSIAKYLPLTAGIQMFSLDHGTNLLSPLGGAVVLCGYCAVVIVIAAFLLRRRDV